MPTRYDPFSNASALVDHPVSRRGTTMVMFLEPKGYPSVPESTKPGGGAGTKPGGGSGTKPGSSGAGTSPGQSGRPKTK